MSKDQDPLLDHEYDGIAEMDNKLPRWWVWLLNGAIIFSFFYLLYFHVLRLGPLQEAKWEGEIARAKGAAPAETIATAGDGATAAPTAEELPSTDAEVLAKGNTIFTANCAACHGLKAEGLIGPNLCDEFWIHGPTFANNLHIIREGVLAKGMISWKAVLKPDDIQAVGSYIFSLRGSNPPNPKAPEGAKAEG